MKVVIAYYSKYGSGKKCVEHLENTLKISGNEVEVVSVTDVKPSAVPQGELYVFSFPTQVGRVPGKMSKFMKKGEFQKGAKYSFINTCCEVTVSPEKVNEMVKHRELIMVGRPVMIKVEKPKGPIEEGYEDKLAEFTSLLLTQ